MTAEQSLDQIFDLSLKEDAPKVELPQGVERALRMAQERFYVAFGEGAQSIVEQVEEETPAEDMKKTLLRVKQQAREEALREFRTKLSEMAIRIAYEFIETEAEVWQILEVVKLDPSTQVNDLIIMVCKKWTDQGKISTLIKGLLHRKRVDFLFTTTFGLRVCEESIPLLIEKVRERYAGH